jgi:hypothetical protein
MADSATILDKSVARESNEEDQKLIQLARKRFTDTLENWSDIRKAAVLDQKYYTGQQDDVAATRALRARGGQPNIKVNMLPNFVQQVENTIRQQNIGLNIHATDEQGTEETAKILQGMVRHIEHISKAKQAYLWAAGSHGALVPGFGFMKLDCAYCPPKKGIPTFDQEIFIRGVKDPMSIVPDFFAQEVDFSDADFWFEFEELSKPIYKERYTGSKLSGPYAKDWGQLSTSIGLSWITPNSCKVAKYWYREPTIRHWAMFEDGTQGFLDEFGAEINDKNEMVIVDKELADESFPRIEKDPDERLAIARLMDSKNDPGAPADQYPITDSMVSPDRLAEVLRTREVVEYEVKWIVTNGYEILDRGDWNDSEFPFVGVIGQDQVIDGKRDIHGIIRYAKDPQKMVNFFTSQVVRRVDAANKSAWIAAAESVPEPQRKYWDNANIENRATLYYNAYDDQGRQLPQPTRGDAIEPAVQQMMAGSVMFAKSIQQTVGIFDAGIGQAAGDRQSGNAIDILAERGENANFHFSDNFVMSMKRLGCLILRLIPKIYDTARVVRTVGLDDEADLVKINQMFSENGQNKMHDIKNAGCYDVVVDTGPTFATKKGQMVDSMLKFAAIEPQLMPFLADLLAKNMDWDTTGAVSDRIQLVQAQQFPWLHPVNGQQKMPPQAVAQITGLQKQIGALQAASQHLQQQYAQEKMINQTNIISHQAKSQQIVLKGYFDQQKQKMALLMQYQHAGNSLALERTKAELEHINQRISSHLDAVELVHGAKMDIAAAAAPGLAAASQPNAPPGQGAPAPGGVAPAQFAPVPTAAPPGLPQPQTPSLPPGIPGLGGPTVQ